MKLTIHKQCQWVVVRFIALIALYAAKILAYGLPSVWHSEYIRLLKEKYGIEMHTVALCIVSETLRSYADSYDEVSAAAANRKFGRDVFQESAEEARKRWESRRALSTARK
jgi:hypothetical protein